MNIDDYNRRPPADSALLKELLYLLLDLLPRQLRHPDYLVDSIGADALPEEFPYTHVSSHPELRARDDAVYESDQSDASAVIPSTLMHHYMGCITA